MNDVGRLVPELHLLSKKALNKIKASSTHLGFKEFWLKPTWADNKIKLVAFQIVDPVEYLFFMEGYTTNFSSTFCE